MNKILILKRFIFFILIIFIIINIIDERNKLKNYKICLCTNGKKENLYVREYVEHYISYGVDKIFIYDNNEENGERFQEVINDYINKGYVEIINYRGLFPHKLKFIKSVIKKIIKNIIG